MSNIDGATEMNPLPKKTPNVSLGPGIISLNPELGAFFIPSTFVGLCWAEPLLPSYPRCGWGGGVSLTAQC